jgi:glycerophosphoryl diester phosphodiesterase
MLSGDLTLEAFMSLSEKMNASAPNETTAIENLGSTVNWLSDRHTGRGHAERIELIRKLGSKIRPELNPGNPVHITQVYGSQQAYDQKLIDEYEAAGVRPHMVWPQLFNGQDALDSIDNTKYGTQARF